MPDPGAGLAGPSPAVKGCALQALCKGVNNGNTMNNNEKAKEEPTALRMSRLLKEKVVPDMLAAGAFGEGWQVDDVTSAPIGGFGEDHWASTTLATSVTLSRAGETRQVLSTESIPLVSKCMLPSDGFAAFFDINIQAENEVNMYNEVLPFFKRLAASSGVNVDNILPKCYWARSRTEGLLSLTIMEDLRVKGFRLAKERAALDRQHVMLALRAIGRMHAWSYAAKARCREEFLSRVTTQVREANYTEKWRDEMAPMMGRVVYRGIDVLEARLLQDGQQDQQEKLDRLRRMRAAVADAYAVMSGAASAREPAAVLAHGDFCRNNMLFRYDQDGQPAEVCLFDFQTSRYCSPALDLSFFLFLNTSTELRAAHWDALLQEYHSSLRAELDRLLEGHDVHPDFVMPTLQMVRDELKQHGLYGYMIASYFLPQMMTPPEEMLDLEEVKVLAVSDPDTLVAKMLEQGGERVSEALAGVVREYVDRDLIP
ncbi:EKC/KEOPS complex subunit BUD32 [Frankliniella fusca]|uniref:EKC/KEOPS complex subunit BUD32 n=1 Tax=Frankliniella fusca TaxID=407009 RepID=A0AAE1I3A5_9NEOP|nr:EKC/KEOPS complex subunit BUD32 [Frankliniella fusca]